MGRGKPVQRRCSSLFARAHRTASHERRSSAPGGEGEHDLPAGAPALSLQAAGRAGHRTAVRTSAGIALSPARRQRDDPGRSSVDGVVGALRADLGRSVRTAAECVIVTVVADGPVREIPNVANEILAGDEPTFAVPVHEPSSEQRLDPRSRPHASEATFPFHLIDDPKRDAERRRSRHVVSRHDAPPHVSPSRTRAAARRRRESDCAPRNSLHCRTRNYVDCIRDRLTTCSSVSIRPLAGMEQADGRRLDPNGERRPPREIVQAAC